MVFVFLIIRPSINKKFLLFSLFLLLISIYSLLIVVLHGSMEAFTAYRSMSSLLNFMGGMAIVILFKKHFKDDFPYKLLNFIFLSIVFHGIIIIGMYINDNFRELIYGITSGLERVNLVYPVIQGLRVPGLTYALSQTSLVQMFGVFILVSFFNNQKRMSGFQQFFLIFCLVTIITSIFLTGRSGMLIGLILIPFVLFLMFKNGILEFQVRKLTTFVAFGSCLLLLTIFVMPEHFFEYNVALFDELIDLLKKGQSATMVYIYENMIFFPEDPLTFLFGSSAFGRGKTFIPSDVGYIRSIFALGIIGTILMLVPFLYGIKISLSLRKNYKLFGIVSAAILLGSLILNFKELALFTRNQWSIQALLICAIFELKKKEAVPRQSPQKNNRDKISMD